MEYECYLNISKEDRKEDTEEQKSWRQTENDINIVNWCPVISIIVLNVNDLNCPPPNLLSYSSGDRKSKMGLMATIKESVDVPGENLFPCLFPSRGSLRSLACSPFLHLQSQQFSIIQSLLLWPLHLSSSPSLILTLLPPFYMISCDCISSSRSLITFAKSICHVR